MKFEHSAYQKPLSLTGFGGGATSLNFIGAGLGEPYWWLGYSGQEGYGSANWGGTRPTAIDIDSDGNIYVLGHSRRVVNTTAAVETFIIKTDKYGTLIWERGFNIGPYNYGYTCEGWGMRVASSGNIYVSGSMSGYSSSFPNGPTNQSIFTGKFNNSGTLQWMRLFGGGGNQYGRGLTIDSSENIYVTGYADIGPNGATSYENAVALKYNSSGTIQWKRYIGRTPSGSYEDYGHAIVVDSSGNYYVSGLHRNTSVFGGAYQKAFLAKNYSNNNHHWSRYYELSGYNMYPGTSDMAIDSSNNIYKVGQMKTGSGKYGGWIIKVDSSSSTGNVLWAKNMFADHLRNVEFYGVTVDDSDNVYVTGRATMEYTGSGSGSTTSDYNGDICIIKFNSSGTEQWKIGIGVNGYSSAYPHSREDYGMTIKVDSTGKHVYIGGITGGMDPRGYGDTPSSPTLQSNGVIIKLPADGGATLTGSYDPSGTFGNSNNKRIVTYGGGKAGGSVLTTNYTISGMTVSNNAANMGSSHLDNYTGDEDVVSSLSIYTPTSSPVIGLSTSGPYPIDEGESGITGFSTSWNPSIPS